MGYNDHWTCNSVFRHRLTLYAQGGSTKYPVLNPCEVLGVYGFKEAFPRYGQIAGIVVVYASQILVIGYLLYILRRKEEIPLEFKIVSFTVSSEVCASLGDTNLILSRFVHSKRSAWEDAER